MTCIADANVLFPLLVQGHVAHDAAMEWWREQSDGTVDTCLLTRLAVPHLLSNRIAMNGDPVRPKEALAACNGLRTIRARSTSIRSRRLTSIGSLRWSQGGNPRPTFARMPGSRLWRCPWITRWRLSTAALDRFAVCGWYSSRRPASDFAERYPYLCPDQLRDRP